MPEGVGYASSNVVAGTGLELNYVGNHVFAFSGQFGESTSAQTALEFQTGNEVITGILQFNCFVGQTDPSAGSRGTCTVSINGIETFIIKADGLSETTPSSETQALTLPPYTTLTATLDSTGTTSTNKGSVIFTGRIYK